MYWMGAVRAMNNTVLTYGFYMHLCDPIGDLSGDPIGDLSGTAVPLQNKHTKLRASNLP